MTKKIGKYVIRTDDKNSDSKTGFPYNEGFIQLKSISFDETFKENTCCNQTFNTEKNSWGLPREVFCPPNIKDGRWSDEWNNVNNYPLAMFFRAFASPNPNGIPIQGQTGITGAFSGLGPFIKEPTESIIAWSADIITESSSNIGVTLVSNFTPRDGFVLNDIVKPGGWFFGWTNSIFDNDNYSYMFLYNDPGVFSYTGWKAYFLPAKGTTNKYTAGCIDNFNKNTMVDLQDCGTTQANCPKLSQPDTPTPPTPPGPSPPTPPTPPTPPVGPSPGPSPSPQKQGLSTGLIVGIVVGILLLLLSTIIFIKFR